MKPLLFILILTWINVIVDFECKGQSIDSLNQGISKVAIKEQISQLSGYISKNPTDSNYYKRGVCNYITKNYPDAISDFTQALLINSKYPEAFLYRSYASSFTGAFEQALLDYIKSILLNQELINKIYNPKCILCSLSTKVDFRPLITKSEEQAPDKAVLYVLNGALYEYSKQFNEALEVYSKAINLSPSLDIAYMRRGIVNLMLNNTNQGLLDLNKAIVLKPSALEYYYYLGVAQYCLQFYQLSIETFKKVLKYSPSADIYEIIGLAYLELFKYDESFQNLKVANNLDENRCLTLFGLSGYYNHKNDKKKFIEYFDKAVLIEPRLSEDTINEFWAEWVIKLFYPLKEIVPSGQVF